jgi:LysR family transcriptional activator of nhaA
MEWLNYHHLFYFWIAAREGSITRAAEELSLSQPTVSAQIKMLEDTLGEKLFRRDGRRLLLTDVGHVARRYADEIFTLGREFRDAVRGQPTGRPLRLAVGLANAVPKLVAYRLLQPALDDPQGLHLICVEDTRERLFAELALHNLDLVLSDTPLGSSTQIRAFSHLLGECDVEIFGAPALARRLRRGFPRSLDGAPFILPRELGPLRRGLEHWFEAAQVRPMIVSEIDDSALIKVLGQAGLGLFAAPSVIHKEICRQYGVVRVGRVPVVRERFYAISAERRLKHPAVVAISESARRELFT